MSELPEVETTVRDLRKSVVGRSIIGANVLQLDAVRLPSPEAFEREIAGAQILAVDRRGKWILIRLSVERTLAIHFMLFGRLRLEPTDAKREPNARVLLHLDDGDDL